MMNNQLKYIAEDACKADQKQQQPKPKPNEEVEREI